MVAYSEGAFLALLTAVDRFWPFLRKFQVWVRDERALLTYFGACLPRLPLVLLFPSPCALREALGERRTLLSEPLPVGAVWARFSALGRWNQSESFAQRIAMLLYDRLSIGCPFP